MKQQQKKNLFIKKNSFKNFLITNDLKSSSIFLKLSSLLFLLLMFIAYWLADQIGKKICRKNPFKKNVKTNTIETKIHLEHSSQDKTKVESNYSLPITRIYPSNSNYQYYHLNHKNKYPYHSHRRYIHVEHDPTNGQIYSRTFYPHFNYYQN